MNWKSEFKSCTIFYDNLVAVELKKLNLNNPKYMGMAILNIAKTTSYDCHYRYMIPELGSAWSAIYTDTYAIWYEIRTSTHYNPIRHVCHHKFDTFSYPQNHIYGIPLLSKKVFGFTKDENNGEFVSLRYKLYALKISIEHVRNFLTMKRTKYRLLLVIFNNIKKPKEFKKSVIILKYHFRIVWRILENLV